MVRKIKPTPILEGQGVIKFYKRMVSFKDDLKKLGIIRGSIERDTAKFKTMFKVKVVGDEK